MTHSIRPGNSQVGGLLVEGTVTWGTLRQPDLLRAYADEYERLLPFNSAKLCAEARATAKRLDNGITGIELAASEILLDLSNELNHLVNPHGFYFGPSEGAGSDIGFWCNHCTGPGEGQ
jgi:hypothetical protein